MHKYDINLTILSLHSPPLHPFTVLYSSFSSLPLGPIPPYAFIFISFSLFLSRFCVHRLVWLRQRRKARPRGNNLSVCTAAWTPGSMRSLPPVPFPWAPQSSKRPILCVHLVLHTLFFSTLSTCSPHGDFPHCYIKYCTGTSFSPVHDSVVLLSALGFLINYSLIFCSFPLPLSLLLTMLIVQFLPLWSTMLVSIVTK